MKYCFAILIVLAMSLLAGCASTGDGSGVSWQQIVKVESQQGAADIRDIAKLLDGDDELAQQLELVATALDALHGAIGDAADVNDAIDLVQLTIVAAGPVVDASDLDDDMKLKVQVGLRLAMSILNRIEAYMPESDK